MEDFTYKPDKKINIWNYAWIVDQKSSSHYLVSKMSNFSSHIPSRKTIT